jgi:hypothetical protein
MSSTSAEDMASFTPDVDYAPLMDVTASTNLFAQAAPVLDTESVPSSSTFANMDLFQMAEFNALATAGDAAQPVAGFEWQTLSQAEEVFDRFLATFESNGLDLY